VGDDAEHGMLPGNMDLNGKTAIVTGASRGIGKEVALALGRRGATVVLVARDVQALNVVADQIGTHRSLVVPADLTDLTQIAGVVERARARFGRIDVLVNNAGMLSRQDFLETSPEQIARTIDLNIRAAAVLTRLVAEGMAARRFGHIVNVASLAGVVGVPGEPVYSATKAALRLLTASLRLELGRCGIGLTDVVLGTVQTGLLEDVEANPRVRRLFDRGRRLQLLVDTPSGVVATAVVRAIERRQDVVVLPSRARLLYLPLQGAARTIVRWLAR
jgi:short-subunit dehydrogenase